MSQSRAREERRRQRMLYLGPQPTESASENVRLALEMRERANLTGRCVCGAVRELFEVIDGGELRDTPEFVPEPGRVFVARFDHAHDCPAVSPDMDGAFARGEIHDPTNGLLP